jgi:hypothetical protein
VTEKADFAVALAKPSAAATDAFDSLIEQLVHFARGRLGMGVVGMAPVAHELAAALDVTGEAMPSRTVSKTVHAGCVIAASREDGRRQRDQQRCAEDHQRGVSHILKAPACDGTCSASVKRREEACLGTETGRIFVVPVAAATNWHEVRNADHVECPRSETPWAK